jgi:hypothetical protein
LEVIIMPKKGSGVGKLGRASRRASKRAAFTQKAHAKGLKPYAKRAR